MSERVPAGVRRRIVDSALKEIPYVASAEERDRALTAVRAAVSGLGPDAAEDELISVAMRAAKTMAIDCRRRLRREKWSDRAPQLLPMGADDEDRAEAAKKALRVLKALPDDLCDWEIERQILKAIEPLCEDIRRDHRIDELTTYGRNRVTIILSRLLREGKIEPDEFRDPLLHSELEKMVPEALEDELDGSESELEVDELVKSIIADELELEEEPDEG